MNFYPNEYIENIEDISINFLKKNNIKGIIIDSDNTVIDFDKKVPERIKKWCENLKKEGIKFCLLSNSNNKEKVGNAAKVLDIPYFYFARKPSKNGYKKAIKNLKEQDNTIEIENIAGVGDQVFTDVLGANRSKLFSILIKQIDDRDLKITRWKRPMERKFIEGYLKKKNKIDNKDKNKD